VTAPGIDTPAARSYRELYRHKDKWQVAASSRIPRYFQIAQVLRARLESRDGPESVPFATEHALCAEFNASRTTVRHALDFLKREGLVVSRRGVGTTGTAAEIAKRAVRASGDPLHGMLKSRPRIVSLGRIPAPARVAKFLAVDIDTPVFAITRVHDLEGAPLSVVRSYLPARLGSGVPRSAWREPMHELLWQRFGLRPARSVHTLRVARATADVAGMLDIGLADPVLSIHASTYLADGSPIRWTDNYFREDRYEYVAEMEWPAPEGAPRQARQARQRHDKEHA
jgi:GntR family transcriptional regulator